MPHIDIKCYPKHLTEKEFSDFISRLTALAVECLKASPSDVSIDYTEVSPERWKADVYDPLIAARLTHLAKRPGYSL